MPINVIEKIHINGSEDQIASYMFDPQNDPTWISGVMEVKSVSDSPVKEGTEIHRIAHFLGKDVDYILKVNKLQKDSLLSMESIKGPVCTVKVQISGESKGYFMFIDRLLSLMVSENVKGDLRKLKDIFEGEEEEGG